MRWILSWVFWSVSAGAVTLEVLAPCDGSRALVRTQVNPGQSVGAATVGVLQRQGIAFQGTASGIHSIVGTPVGDSALEVISDTEMRAYGWCFKVDGQVAPRLPHQVALSGAERRVTWYFAYAHYVGGEWRRWCVPVYESRPKFVCSGR